MDNRGGKSLGWLLTANLYRQLESEFNAGRVSVYILTCPVAAPGRLSEFHRIADSYHSIEIVYGPWAPSEDLLRVLTWHDIPGQEEITPGNYLGFQAEDATPADAEVDGQRVTGTLGTAGEAWVWTAAVRESHLIVTSRGDWPHLSLTSTGNIADAVANGKAFTQRGFQ